jgi:hypothetical protein
VLGDRDIAHAAEQRVELFRLGMGEFDELEAVGAGGVVVGDLRRGRVVRKRSHGVLLECVRDCEHFLKCARGKTHDVCKGACVAELDARNVRIVRNRCT